VGCRIDGVEVEYVEGRHELDGMHENDVTTPRRCRQVTDAGAWKAKVTILCVILSMNETSTVGNTWRYDWFDVRKWKKISNARDNIFLAINREDYRRENRR